MIRRLLILACLSAALIPRARGAEPLEAKLCAMAEDPDARVRLQVAVALAGAHTSERITALAKIARRDGGDKFFRTAILSSAGEGAGELIEALGADPAEGEKGTRTILRDLASQVAVRGKPEDARRAVRLAARIEEGHPGEAAAILSGMASGLRLAEGRTLGIQDIDEPLLQLLSSKNSGIKNAALSIAPGLLPARDEIIERLLEEATKFAADEKRPEGERITSIQFLRHGDFERTRGVLSPLLEARNSEGVQLAVLGALDHYSQAEAGGMILRHVREFTPAARNRALDAMLARPERTELLLAALEKGELQPSILDAPRRNRLFDQPNLELGKRAQSIFDRKRGEEDPKLFEKYKKAADMEGDKAAGAKIFKDRCAQCHKAGGEGFALGPDLKVVQSNTRETILNNILYPSRVIAPGFTGYVIETKDGRVATGLTGPSGGSSVTLRRAGGEEETILRENIKSLSDTALSMMPEGLEDGLQVEEMAGLLTFVKEIE